MTREAAPIEFSAMPDLARLAEEVRRSVVPRVLRRANEDVAILSPAPAKKRRRPRTPTPEDLEALHAAAGSWKGLIDRDSFLAGLHEGRRSSRPPVSLRRTG